MTSPQLELDLGLPKPPPERGRCLVCGRKLSSADSVRYKVGPVCFGKVVDFYLNKRRNDG
jgi:hypothetical protein